MFEKTIWIPRRKGEADQEKIRSLAKEASIDLITASILDARGFSDQNEIKEYLNPSTQQLRDPFLLPDMDKAVDRIMDAIENEESIVIYADYDADGTCAASILVRYLRKAGAQVKVYIPNRLTEGYGMNIGAVEKIVKAGVRLVLTVDNGISSMKEAAYLKEAGVDLIITDHHEAHDTLPDACAIVDPKRRDCQQAYREYCGAGIAYKLVCALDTVLGLLSSTEEYLQLVALATIADMVPLLGENRALAALGIKSINREVLIPGLKALLDVQKLTTISSEDLSFRIAPQLNAPGRLGRSMDVVNLFTRENLDEKTINLAREIVTRNEDRKGEEKRIVEEAKRFVSDMEEDATLVLAKEGWHAGVIGLAASRIQDLQYKPAVVIGGTGEVLKGSCRSVEGFNMFEALTACSDLLEGFGGHEMAAGLTIKRENIDPFRRRLNGFAKERKLISKPVKKIPFDVRIKPHLISEDLINILSRFEPYGQENPAPKIIVSPIFPEQVRLIGNDKSHLSFSLSDMRCLYFRRADQIESFSYPGAMVANPKINDFNGKKSVQCILEDFKPSPFCNILESVKVAKRLTSLSDEDALRELEEIWRTFRPDPNFTLSLGRDSLVRVFKILKVCPKVDGKELIERTQLSPMTVALCLEILSQEGLIIYTLEGYTFSTELIPQQEKRDITKSRLYQLSETFDKRTKENGFKRKN